MSPWDVYQWEFPHGSHPVVIVAPQARCDNPDLETVNVAACSSQRANRQPRIHEVVLDKEDGLDWESLCRCDALWLVQKAQLMHRRGSVSPERRRAIGQKIIQLFGLHLP
jgi:mRNA-degrading endonuclease toxin of MazEF toxin-antitoxin module